MTENIRADFEKVKRPQEYKFANLGMLQIPITVVAQDGTTETSDNWMRDASLMHPLEHKYPWSLDAFSQMYRQMDAIKFRTPEALHCFSAIGGRLFITEGDVDDYKRHVLGVKNVAEPKPGTFTFGNANTNKDVCVDSRGVFHKITERGAQHTTFIHEIVHVTDLDTNGENPTFGRFSKTDLMKAVLNIEINTRFSSVSGRIYKDIQHYKHEDQLLEYLPRLFQQYVADQQTRNPKYKKLSELELALIEKVYLPDCKLRANGEVAKAAVLRTEYSRSFDEMMLGANIRNQDYMGRILTQDPPKNIHLDFHAEKAAKTIREELLSFMDEIPDNAADYCQRLERKRQGRIHAAENEGQAFE